jgi:hypothetical protein
LVGDLAEECDRATERVPVIAGYHGGARVAAYTVAYDQLEPVRTTVVADTSTGERCVATCSDTALARRATTEEMIGTAIDVDGTTFRLP